MLVKDKVSIIDLGSNSLRLNIYTINDDGSYKLIDEAKENVRLSEGMGADMILKPVAMNRTMSVLRSFNKLIEVHNVGTKINVATAAVRNSINGQVFIQKVKNEVGLEFDIISGEREAYLGYQGAVNTIDIKNFILVDTGGGSTEITVVKDKKIIKSASLPIGAVVISEKFQISKNGKIPSEQIKKMQKYVAEMVSEVLDVEGIKNFTVIGLGGSIRTLSKIDRNCKETFLGKVSQYIMNYGRIEEIYSQLCNSSLEERKNIKGLAKDRADIIIGGLCPIVSIMKILQSTTLIVSSTGLKEGIFFDYYLKKTQNKYYNVLDRVLENVLKNYDMNIEHARHVYKISSLLFDQLKSLHNLDDSLKKILYAASMLHDIGIYINYEDHNKHSLYLILNSNIHGLNARELIMTGLIAYLHDEYSCKIQWSSYENILSKDDIEIVKKLAIFVNMGEKLDRNESSYINDIKCYETTDSIQIMLDKSDLDAEFMIDSIREDNSFKKVFNKELYIF